MDENDRIAMHTTKKLRFSGRSRLPDGASCCINGKILTHSGVHLTAFSQVVAGIYANYTPNRNQFTTSHQEDGALIMANQVVDNQEALKPPTDLSEEERWIVRLHGQDMGPFSTKALYPKLLTGEIEPETLLLDQNRFSRCRLHEITELQPYLELHNTQNPVLLREQKAQERDEYWEKTGKKRMMIGIASGISVIVAAFVIWRVFIYQSSDVYLQDGDHQFSFEGFKGVKKKKGYKKFNDIRYRRRKGRKGGKAGATGPSAATVDFTNGGGSGIPRKKLSNYIRGRIRSIFGCFKMRMQMDSRFTGGNIEFSIMGTTGKVTRVRVIDTDYASTSLNSCIRRRAKRWQMPTFPGSAVVYFPVYIRKKRTRW